MRSPLNPDDVYIGLRLRARRLDLGLSQTDVGEPLGVSFQQIQKYERGTNRISGSVIVKLADVLDCPPAYFFEGAPGVRHRAGDPPAPRREMSDFMASSDGITIAQSFVRIASPEIRRSIVHLIETSGRPFQQAAE